MNLNLELKYSNGESKSVSAIAADIVAFEGHFDLSIAQLEKNVRLTHLLYLAWHAEKRAKQTDLAFEPWIETVESIAAVDSKK